MDNKSRAVDKIESAYSNIGLKVVGGEYKNNTSKLEMIDMFGYRYRLNLSSITSMVKNNSEPSITNSNPHASQNIKLFVELNCNGIEVISDIDNNFKVKIRCSEGHVNPINIYHLMERKRCPECQRNKKLTIENVRKEFMRRGFVLLENSYKNNSTKMEFICNNHKELGIQRTSYACVVAKGGCKGCHSDKTKLKITKPHDEFIVDFKNIYGDEFDIISEYTSSIDLITVMHIDCGKPFERTPKILLRKKSLCPNCQNHGMFANSWKGGLSPIRQYIRDYCKDIFDIPTFSKCDYKCVITGVKHKLIIHHLYSFSSMLNEAISDLKLKNTVSDYTDEEINIIKERVKNEHLLFGLGVSINESVHRLFHSAYGIKNNNHLQFKEFIQRLKLGEFDSHLKDNGIELNLNISYLNKLGLL